MTVVHKMLLFKEFAGFQTSPNKRMEALLAIAGEFLWLPLETQASWGPARTLCSSGLDCWVCFVLPLSAVLRNA